jgi:hypothetical protein
MHERKGRRVMAGKGVLGAPSRPARVGDDAGLA